MLKPHWLSIIILPRPTSDSRLSKRHGAGEQGDAADHRLSGKSMPDPHGADGLGAAGRGVPDPGAHGDVSGAQGRDQGVGGPEREVGGPAASDPESLFPGWESLAGKERKGF